jgi:hypothetical protein
LKVLRLEVSVWIFLTIWKGVWFSIKFFSFPFYSLHFFLDFFQEFGLGTVHFRATEISIDGPSGPWFKSGLFAVVEEASKTPNKQKSKAIHKAPSV